ncbi:hypothetical protein GN244_ATG00975 [Phytophthora infestans]|uniref:Uncharacterized protein n=1 Tax=Phytophthora infestans TaxID=4787 RepID=A0A833TP41_PHYIN|nr:hypothetical protein GN244_ATG00975 [Phytophthora infestans]
MAPFLHSRTLLYSSCPSMAPWPQFYRAIIFALHPEKIPSAACKFGSSSAEIDGFKIKTTTALNPPFKASVGAASGISCPKASFNERHEKAQTARDEGSARLKKLIVDFES